MDDTISAAIRTIVREEVRAHLDRQARTDSRLSAGRGEVERQYSVKAAADLLGVSVQYIYDRMDDGELPRRLDLAGSKAKYRIPASDLQRFIDNRTTPHPPPQL